MNDQLNTRIPGIAPTYTPLAGEWNVLSLSVAPIQLNLLGIVLQTDRIKLF